MNRYTFETDRLSIRPTHPDDADLVLASMNTPEFLRFVGDRNVRTKEEAENYIRTRHLPQIEKLGYGNFTLIEKNTGKKVGGCGIFHRDGLDVADIGFSMLPEYYGKGFGYEGAAQILAEGFNSFGLQKISAITVKENIASRKLIEKLGLTFRNTVFLPNDPEELLYYEISEEEFRRMG